jgi:hypothetical protein
MVEQINSFLKTTNVRSLLFYPRKHNHKQLTLKLFDKHFGDLVKNPGPLEFRNLATRKKNDP